MGNSKMMDCINLKYGILLEQEIKKFLNGYVIQDPNEIVYPIDRMVIRVGKRRFVKIRTSIKFY